MDAHAGQIQPSRKALRNGAFALLGGQWGKYLLQLLSFVVLARLLPPSDFGLMTMVTSVLGVATVIGDLGLSGAALQREHLSQAQKSNLFWLNVIAGSLMAILAVAVSPAIAAFFEQPILFWICVSFAVTFAFGGIGVQFRVELNRAHRYKLLAGQDLLSQLIAFLLAIGAAVAGFGVWALVAQAVTASAVSNGWALIAARWLPSRWSRSEPVRGFLAFGFNTLAVQLLNYTSTNIANVVIGRVSSPGALGLYSRATQLVSLPVQQLASPLTRIALPYLATRSRDSPVSLTQAAVALQRVLVTTLVGALSLLALTADPLVSIVLGSEWAPTAPLVQILAVGGVFQCLGYLYYWLFLSTAQTGSLFFAELPGRLLQIVLVFLLWPLGLEAVAWTFTASQFFVWLTGTLFFVARTGVRTHSLIVAGSPTVALYAGATVIGLIVGRLVTGVTPELQMVIGLFSWLLIVGFGVLCVPSCRSSFAGTLAVMRNRRVL